MRTKLLMCSISLAALSVCGTAAIAAAAAQPALYIVQADSSAAAAAQVLHVHAQIEQPLEIIHAVAAYLRPGQLAELEATPHLRVYEDRAIGTRGGLLSGVTSSLISTANTVTSQVVAPMVGAVVSTP